MHLRKGGRVRKRHTLLTHLSERSQKHSMDDCIEIKGARVNNLKNIDVRIPRNKFIVIAGVSGSGKTVFLQDVAQRLRKDPNWVVGELDPGQGISNSVRLSLEAAKKHKKRILLIVDDADNSEQMWNLVDEFQILLMQCFPVLLLFTGSLEDINSMQKSRNFTFLSTAPKLELRPLDLGTIAQNYVKRLSVSETAARQMAKMTKGYPFAFQALGYFTWAHGGLCDEALADYRHCLNECVYEKLWSALSAQDRRVLFAIASTRSGKIEEVRSLLNMDTNHFNPYRSRLIKKGLVSGDVYGYVSFALPMFGEYVLDNYEEVT